MNTVPRITVQAKKLFSPKLEQLEKKATKLHQSLQEKFPNHAYIIVYNFDPSNNNLGSLEVYKSLDSTIPYIVTNPLDNSKIDSPDTRYSVIKSLKFSKKLQLLDVELAELPATERVLLYINR